MTMGSLRPSVGSQSGYGILCAALDGANAGWPSAWGRGGEPRAAEAGALAVNKGHLGSRGTGRAAPVGRGGPRTWAKWPQYQLFPRSDGGHGKKHLRK